MGISLDLYSTRFGKVCGLSPAALALLDCSALEIINSTIDGLMLTKNSVPELDELVIDSDHLNLPRKIYFGRVEKNNN